VLDGVANIDSSWLMIRAGFLLEAERHALIGLARDGLAEHRIARRPL